MFVVFAQSRAWELGCAILFGNAAKAKARTDSWKEPRAFMRPRARLSVRALPLCLDCTALSSTTRGCDEGNGRADLSALQLCALFGAGQYLPRLRSG
jgi:hypothetical protein